MKTIKVKYWSDAPNNYTGIAIDKNGHKKWYLNGKYHREDGPASEYAGGSKVWYLNGEYHREDGPAVEYASGGKSWFLNNKQYTEDEHRKKTAYLRTSIGKIIFNNYFTLEE